MDDIFTYLIGGAVLAVLIIVINHRRQKHKVTDFLKDAKGSQSVFQQAAVEKKIKTLKVALYGNTTGIQLQADALDGGNVAATLESQRQGMINRLNQLQQAHAAGSLSLTEYDHQLHELVMMLNQE